jgi:hypothetical protein
MEKNKKAQIIPIDWQRKNGVWLSPENAAPYFRNGKGIAIGTLYNNLRAGKLSDVAMRDSYGWLVFVPQVWLDNKNFDRNPLKAA